MATYPYPPRRPYAAPVPPAPSTPPMPLYVPEPCARCHATGRLTQTLHAYCERCNASWSAAALAAWLDGFSGGWWGYRVPLLGDLNWQVFGRLPCGCYKRHCAYTAAQCPACRGDGVTYRQATVRDLRRLGLLVSDDLATPVRGYPPIPPMRALTPRLRN